VVNVTFSAVVFVFDVCWFSQPVSSIYYSNLIISGGSNVIAVLFCFFSLPLLFIILMGLGARKFLYNAWPDKPLNENNVCCAKDGKITS